MWRTESESANVDGLACHVERDGIRWKWTAQGGGSADLYATGYATSQDVARADAERVARGLKALLG